MRKKIPLPPCGIFVGSGVYNTDRDYLVGSGRIHTTWLPQSLSPLEILDKIIEDNQGNLAQLWAYSGGVSPTTFARHYALEDIGLTPPPPDWEHRKNLKVEDWIDPRQYASRSGAGVLKFVQRAAEKGIYSILLYTEAEPEWSQRFEEAGDFYLGYDFGEIFSFRLDDASIAGKSLREVTLPQVAQELVARVRRHVDHRHATGWGNVMATSGNFYLDYEIAGGANIPLVEDFAYSHLNMASALSRGLYRQYDLPIWGSHLAHEHYSWLPYSSPYKFPLLRAAMYHKYMAGCKILINESGNWFLQAQLVTDSPMFETPRVEPGGSIKQRAPELAIPYLGEARASYPLIDYSSPVARQYRQEISDFYDFVKEKGTPEGQPETTLALIKGNYDLCGQEFSPNAAIAGAFALADENPEWFEGAPERGWVIAREVFFPRPPVLAPHHNRFLSGTPYGQIDLVSFAMQVPSAAYLQAQYKALLFCGWNTASVEQYEVLTEYVRAGGILFVSIPHLSTNTKRNYNSYSVDELVHGGDFSELCGVKIHGRGRRFYWATAPDKKGTLGFEIPRRLGITMTCLGDIEIIDPTAEVLAVEEEEVYPVLICRRLGDGTVYFLNSWAYPGALDKDEGPGSTIDSPGLIGYIYQHIARQARGEFWMTDDGREAGPQCRYIAYSFFPESGRICLQNIDFDNPHRCYLHHGRGTVQIELNAGEFRMMSTDDLAFI